MSQLEAFTLKAAESFFLHDSQGGLLCKKKNYAGEELQETVDCYPDAVKFFECPDRVDGHKFLPCDEWSETCTCGAMQS